MSAHRHRMKERRTIGYEAPVKAPQNQAAHGNVTHVDTCSCGAERRTNVNQRHVERGEWMMPRESEVSS